MTTFQTIIDIDSPADRVWQVMSDTERWHEWTPSITRVTLVGGNPFAVGSRAAIRQPKLPPATWRITAIEPDKGFTWVNTAPGIRVTGHHWIEPMSAASRVTLTLELEGIFSGPLAWMTKGITERYLGFEARGLKARSEDPSFFHEGTI